MVEKADRTAAVTASVLLHLPICAHAASMHYRMADMPMDSRMLAGMALIAIGTLLARAGLGPAATRLARWGLVLSMLAALIINMMKPATLGFIVPGMAQEYGLARSAPLTLSTSAVTAWL